VLRVHAAAGHPTTRPRTRVGHRDEVSIGPYALLGCFHPSQQNTFTGKLTPAMLDDVLRRAAEIGTSTR
jgi:uracil-DNA glycosylase